MGDVKAYRKRPVVIEAAQFVTNNEVGSPDMDDIVNWVNQGRSEVGAWHNGTDIFIVTPGGNVRVTVGDFVIRDATGKFYHCLPDIFAATYELVEGENDGR